MRVTCRSKHEHECTTRPQPNTSLSLILHWSCSWNLITCRVHVYFVSVATSQMSISRCERCYGAETRSYFNGRTVTAAFCRLRLYGTEFSYVIFTERRNFTTAKRRNGNGRTATEWWKPGTTHRAYITNSYRLDEVDVCPHWPIVRWHRRPPVVSYRCFWVVDAALHQFSQHPQLRSTNDDHAQHF